MRLRRLDDDVSVAGQIGPHQVSELRALGVTMLINNRPDGEEPGQPAAAAIAASAKAAGIEYRFIPIAGPISAEQIETMALALAVAGGPALAFCRSGTRSTFLWALARLQLGDDWEALIAKAAAAGYDLAPIAALLRR